MIPSETYYTKRIKLNKQYALYDNFLKDTELTFEQRTKLIFEMGRILSVINQIDNMTLMETRKKTDDYPLVIPSTLNEKIMPLKL